MIYDEIITVEEYNIQWPALYELEKQKLESAFCGIVIEIEHIGSTSVVGMKANSLFIILSILFHFE